MTAVLVALCVAGVFAGIRPRPPARAAVAVAPAKPRAPSLGVARRALTRWRRQRPATAGELAGWCDGMARALRAGVTLHQVVRTVPPPDGAAARMAPVLQTLERGASLRRALASAQPGSPDLDLVLVVLRACADHGGAPAEPDDRAAAALRQRAAILAERRAHSAQARLSAIVMTLLPIAVLCLLIVSSAPARSAATSPLGAAGIAAGCAWNAVGWWWMRRLIGAVS